MDIIVNTKLGSKITACSANMFTQRLLSSIKSLQESLTSAFK